MINLVRNKCGNNFIGINTGMNSLMRPVLYDAYHGIHNISRIDNNKEVKYDIVGPICESGDILGSNRIMPKTEINDLILWKKFPNLRGKYPKMGPSVRCRLWTRMPC